MRKPIIVLICVLIVILLIPVFLGIGLYSFANQPINETRLPQAQLEIKETVEHYQVYGQNHWDVRNSMDRFGPNGFDAFTSVVITYEHPCGQQNPRVNLEVTYEMPKLNTEDESLQSEWDEYYDALLEHEKNHGRIALVHAQQLLDELYNLEPTGNCFVHYSNTLEIYTRILGELAEAQRNYDQETSHGFTEGVDWN